MRALAAAAEAVRDVLLALTLSGILPGLVVWAVAAITGWSPS